MAPEKSAGDPEAGALEEDPPKSDESRAEEGVASAAAMISRERSACGGMGGVNEGVPPAVGCVIYVRGGVDHVLLQPLWRGETMRAEGERLAAELTVPGRGGGRGSDAARGRMGGGSYVVGLCRGNYPHIAFYVSRHAI